MLQETNKEVINAAFFELLTRNGVYIDYFCCWAEKKYIPYGKSVDEAWKSWAETATPECYVIGAFVFDRTHIPGCMWNSVHEQWKIWVADNLNN